MSLRRCMKPLKDASMPADTADEVDAAKKLNGIQQKQAPPKCVSEEKIFEILGKPQEKISGEVFSQAAELQLQ